MNKYYIQRISAETCEDIIKKYQPKKQEDIIILGLKEHINLIGLVVK